MPLTTRHLPVMYEELRSHGIWNDCTALDGVEGGVAG